VLRRWRPVARPGIGAHCMLQGGRTLYSAVAARGCSVWYTLRAARPNGQRPEARWCGSSSSGGSSSSDSSIRSSSSSSRSISSSSLSSGCVAAVVAVVAALAGVLARAGPSVGGAAGAAPSRAPAAHDDARGRGKVRWRRCPAPAARVRFRCC
jgi:hypothetical protein